MSLVSVIIPCKNEAHHIRRCVHSVLANHYEQIEVLVVDGISEDWSVAEAGSITDPRLKIINNPLQHTAAAFNTGIAHARGEVIIILNARCTISRNYISECVRILASEKQVGCVGGVGYHISHTPVQRAIALAMQSKTGVGFRNYRTYKSSRYVDTVWTPAYRKEIFEQVGLFDESLTRNQDEAFNFSVTQAGYKIYMSDAIQVHYEARDTFSKLFSQYLQYGYWKFKVNVKYRRLITLRQAAPPLLILFILSFPLWLLVKAGFIYYSILLFYVILVLVSAALSAGGTNEIILAAFAIFIMHFSYGIGYLRSVIDAVFRNRQAPAFEKINH